MKPLVFKTNLGETFFDYHDIIRLEADGCHTSIYNSKGEVLKSSVNISSIEKLLPEKNFFRSHRSHIVNLSFISNYNGKLGVLTVAEYEVPISETYQQKFMELFSSGNRIYIR